MEQLAQLIQSVMLLLSFVATHPNLPPAFQEGVYQVAANVSVFASEEMQKQVSAPFSVSNVSAPDPVQGQFGAILEASPVILYPISVKINPEGAQNLLGRYCSKTEVIIRALDQYGEDMEGVPIEVLNTFTGETKISSTSPFRVSFGWNGMMVDTSYYLKIKAGEVEKEQLYRIDGTFGEGMSEDKAKNSGLNLVKTDRGYVCKY